MHQPRFFAGVDGGGTRCRVRLRDAFGRERAMAEGGAANVHLDVDGALSTIRATLDAALTEAGLIEADRRDIALGLGLAGIVTADDPARIASALGAWHSIHVTGDAHTACLGAHAGVDGGLVIAGTGSAGFVKRGATTGTIGGRGFLIGDEGSAARIGWEALRQALLAADGLRDSTPLTDALMKRFSDDPAAVTRWAATARSADYGALAPIVLGHADKGDVLGVTIVKAAAHALAALASALEQHGATRIALVGGLSGPILSWIDLEAPGRFVTPLHDAADGAILLAGGIIA